MKKYLLAAALLASAIPAVSFARDFSSVPCTSLTINLKAGYTDASSGGQVTLLQKFLLAAGYVDSTSVTGTFADRTTAGVVSFQSEQGIVAGGAVGPATRAKIQQVSCSRASAPTLSARAPAASRAAAYGTTPLSVATDSSSPASQLVVGGSTSVIVGIAKFRATGDSVNLNTIGLSLTSGSAQDIASVSIWDPAPPGGGAPVKVGTGVFTAGNTTAYVSISPVLAPQDVDKTLVIKADLSMIGSNLPGIEGDLIAIDVLGSNTSGGTVTSNDKISASGATSFSGVRIFRSIPTIALENVPFSGAMGGVLMEFRVTASSAGSLGISQLNFTIATSGIGMSGQIGTTLLGDAVPTGAMASSYKVTQSSNFVWSPNATGTSELSASDWTNGYSVPGLSSSGLSQSRNDASVVTNVSLYGFTDSGYSLGISGVGYGGLVNAAAQAPRGANGTVTITPSSRIEIPAGTTYYFKLIGFVTQQGNPALGSLVVSNTSYTGSVSANASLGQQDLGKFLLSASSSPEGVKVSAFPLTLIPINGGNANALSGCQLFNNGVPLNTSANIPSLPGSTMPVPVNFTFDAPLIIQKGTAQSLTLRCVVADSAAAGSQYAWAPTYSQVINMNVTGVSTSLNIMPTAGNLAAAPFTVPGGSVTPPVQPPISAPVATPSVTPNPNPNTNPIGSLDGASCSTIYGWTCDGDDYNKALAVHVYTEAGFLTQVTANGTREPQVGAACGGGTSAHGYSFATPDSLKDGKAHQVAAYGINIGGGNANSTLGGSPRTLACAPGQTSGNSIPTPAPVVAPAPAVTAPTIIGNVSASCQADRATAVVGDTVNWTAIVSGGIAGMKYQWSLDVGNSTGGAVKSWDGAKNLSATYSAAGNKYAALTVVAPDGSKTVQCSSSISVSPVPVPVTVAPLGGSCSVDKSQVFAGGSATWTVILSGGSGPFTYAWSLSGGSVVSNSPASTLGVRYDSAGSGYAAGVTVKGGDGQSKSISCSNTVNVVPAVTPNPNTNPIGSLDGASCSTIYGWTCDGDDYNQALAVHVYTEGGFLTQVLANGVREPQVGAACGNGTSAHGYSFPTPDSLKDGKAHQVAAYGINIGGGNANSTLGGSPRTITCAPGQTSLNAAPSSGSQLASILEAARSLVLQLRTMLGQ